MAIVQKKGQELGQLGQLGSPVLSKVKEAFLLLQGPAAQQKYTASLTLTGKLRVFIQKWQDIVLSTCCIVYRLSRGNSLCGMEPARIAASAHIWGNAQWLCHSCHYWSEQ